MDEHYALALQQRPLMVLIGVIVDWADIHSQGCRVELDQGDKFSTTILGGLDGIPESIAVSNQLIEKIGASWKPGDNQGAERSKKSLRIKLMGKVAEASI
ncbi:MAG: hypothetical protein FJY58_10145 [Betaproteobacteria bacterium]|nr:hypothetical protein [Betaproteobacteria bacterium]